jgi:hypothetical protein
MLPRRDSIFTGLLRGDRIIGPRHVVGASLAWKVRFSDNGGFGGRHLSKIAGSECGSRGVEDYG